MKPTQYRELAALMVTDFYGNGQDMRGVTGLSSLEGDQLADLKKRFSPNLPYPSAVLCVREEGRGGAMLGGVSVGVTPFSGETLVASMDALQRPEDGCTMRPVISNLVVSRDARGRGLAQQLVRGCEAECVEWGYDEVRLLVDTRNKAARKLYSKLGYKPVGRSVQAATFAVQDGAVQRLSVSNLYMRKSLKGGLVGAIENANWPLVFGVALLPAVYSRLTEGSLLDVDTITALFKAL